MVFDWHCALDIQFYLQQEQSSTTPPLLNSWQQIKMESFHAGVDKRQIRVIFFPKGVGYFLPQQNFLPFVFYVKINIVWKFM